MTSRPVYKNRHSSLYQGLYFRAFQAISWRVRTIFRGGLDCRTNQQFQKGAVLKRSQRSFLGSHLSLETRFPHRHLVLRGGSLIVGRVAFYCAYRRFWRRFRWCKSLAAQSACQSEDGAMHLVRLFSMRVGSQTKRSPQRQFG